jgi:hypothetical protein
MMRITTATWKSIGRIALASSMGLAAAHGAMGSEGPVPAVRAALKCLSIDNGGSSRPGSLSPRYYRSFLGGVPGTSQAEQDLPYVQLILYAADKKRVSVSSQLVNKQGQVLLLMDSWLASRRGSKWRTFHGPGGPGTWAAVDSFLMKVTEQRMLEIGVDTRPNPEECIAEREWNRPDSRYSLKVP